jgi:4'-phosphopantetheinyl transferase
VTDPASEVRVCTVHTDEAATEPRLTSYRTVLSPDEVQRANRFLRPADSARFVIGRALARTMLSRHADVAPGQWVFRLNEHGRPELAERPPGTADLRFNLTHTAGIVACALTIGREVGVDVECVARMLVHEIPERFFSPREVRDLRALPPQEQDEAFFDYWTLKEAYIKARGFGLVLPLHHFSFVRRPGQAPTIVFAPELHDDPGSWQFAQFWPTREHRMAVAVRRQGPDLPIRVERVVPEITE